MAIFEYVGIDSTGKSIKGSIDAESDKMARIKLKERGLYITKIKIKGKAVKDASTGKKSVATTAVSGRVKLRDISNMTRQLATLVKAQVPLVEALSAIQEQVDDVKLKEVIGRVKSRVNEGSSLAKAMDDHPKVFNQIYVSMIRAGESSGALEVVLRRLAEFIENSVKLRSKIISSMVYPVILGFVSILIVSGLLTFVVPKMTEMFEDQDKALPMITIVLIEISNLFKNYWFMMLVSLIFAGILFKRYIETEKGRVWLDSTLLRLPLFGITIRKIVISRFTRTLATLLGSGVHLVKALEIVRAVVVNEVIAKCIDNVRHKVQEGESLAKNLKSSGHFPPIVTHMIAIGEKSGGKELEEMLENIADSYDGEVENALIGLTSIIEPLLIIVLGGFVAFVVVAIILPILEMSNIS